MVVLAKRSVGLFEPGLRKPQRSHITAVTEGRDALTRCETNVVVEAVSDSWVALGDYSCLVRYRNVDLKSMPQLLGRKAETEVQAPEHKIRRIVVRKPRGMAWLGNSF